MVTRTIPYEKSAIMQKELDHKYFICTDADGLLFTPNPDPDETSHAVAVNTHFPTETNMPHWNSINYNWTRSSLINPSEYKAIISLLGINTDGTEHLIGEDIITTIGAEVTETRGFDLRYSAAYPPLLPVNGAAANGKIQINLPFRRSHFETLVLVRCWLEGWNKRKSQIISNDSGILIPSQVLEYIVAYDSDMKNDFSDIRFIDADGITPLKSFLVTKTDGVSAVYDVEYNTIPLNGEKSCGESTIVALAISS
jgi:hypothetical protein